MCALATIFHILLFRGVGNSDKDYFELKLHVDERRSIHSQLWLQQLRFANERNLSAAIN